MNKQVIEIISPEMENKIYDEISGLTFTKNFRSATAEEWYIFLPNYRDLKTGGAAGKAIIHYELQGNREIFINTTVIYDDPKLFDRELHSLVYAISDELIQRLVGYANTLLAVHAGDNSYNAEYIR
ncbi:hypothetical protein [Evansella tamaricis]|uniref:Uncharacterized protein n=1 Tax=Evansella tamaricis TaxID=2069301 RepID=A0ABS6JGT6_9BACI|nr:hypothetical protein [Evansella tamaricis]MBU9712857.1 hypothetical protein [Evansella tamaricis]